MGEPWSWDACGGVYRSCKTRATTLSDDKPDAAGKLPEERPARVLLLHSGALSSEQLKDRHLGPGGSSWVEVLLPTMGPQSALMVHAVAHPAVDLRVVNGRVWLAHNFVTTHTLEDGRYVVALASDTTSSWTHTVILQPYVSDVWLHHSDSGVFYMEERPHIEFSVVSGANENSQQRRAGQEAALLVTSREMAAADIVDHSGIVLPVQVNFAFVTDSSQCFADKVLMCAFDHQHNFAYDCAKTNSKGYAALNVPAGVPIVVRDGCPGTDITHHVTQCESNEMRENLTVVVTNMTQLGEPVTELVIPAEQAASGLTLRFEDRTKVF